MAKKDAPAKIFKAPAVPKFNFRTLAICILMVCWAGIAVIFSQIAVYLIFVNFIASKEALDLPLYSALYSAAMYLFALLLIIFVPWLIFKKWRPSLKELGLSGLPTWTDIGLAIVGLMLYFLLAGLVVLIFQAIFPWFNAEEAQDVGFNNLVSNTDRLIAFVALVAVAPIAEELIFRGWLYGKLRLRIYLPVAILLTSLLFAVLHGQWNVGVNVFVMSIVLCLQRELTGTIYSGVLLHMLKNAIAFWLLYMA